MKTFTRFWPSPAANMQILTRAITPSSGQRTQRNGQDRRAMASWDDRLIAFLLFHDFLSSDDSLTRKAHFLDSHLEPEPVKTNTKSI